MIDEQGFSLLCLLYLVALHLKIKSICFDMHRPKPFAKTVSVYMAEWSGAAIERIQVMLSICFLKY